MDTPITEFVKKYAEENKVRFHMPGHKGKPMLGFEQFDITEVAGADALYEAEGIIAQSEANATHLFGTVRTVYATEGSSQCIRAMLYLAMTSCKRKGRPTVVAARNVHKAFVYAAALLDLDVIWLWPEESVYSVCSCPVAAEQLADTLQSMEEPPVAVYITSPDYLGGQSDLASLAAVCHAYGTILAVDNAHGAYLHFLETPVHPIDCGADICCDSAHKTLPVLTGGAYLQISKTAPEYFGKKAKQAMALFGSTSPSYLTLASLDACNFYMAEGYREILAHLVERLEEVREKLRGAGWQVPVTDPLKLTICTPNGLSGTDMAEDLRKRGLECEYADERYMVCMITPENEEEDFVRLLLAVGENKLPYEVETELRTCSPRACMTIREALFAKQETVLLEEAEGRICGTPTVSCPPAVPVVISGELIDKTVIEMLRRQRIARIEVVCYE